MKKIIKENGKIYEVTTEEYYGSISIKKEEIGTYEEINDDKTKKKKVNKTKEQVS